MFNNVEYGRNEHIFPLIKIIGNWVVVTKGRFFCRFVKQLIFFGFVYTKLCRKIL